jgi:hypothetical protein
MIIGSMTLKQTYQTMTRAEAEALTRAGHVAHIYPRKRIVVVDGCTRFQLRGK